MSMVAKEKRVAVFAHHDVDGIVDRYVLRYLEGLSEVAGVVVFVSDCDLADGEIAKLGRLTSVVCAGRHGEYDFGSYKRGVRVARDRGWLDGAEELILCNDSCYGPLRPLTAVCERKSLDDWDLYGITSSIHGYIRTDAGYEPTISDPHVQSYFMILSRRLFLSEVFTAFMEDVRREPNKSDVVYRYELGFSRAVAAAGFRLGSFVGTDVAFDDTHGVFTKWRELVFDARTPFVKYQAFTLYHADISSLGALYPTMLIRRNLLRRLGLLGYLRAVHPSIFSRLRTIVRLLRTTWRAAP